jgi:hypothetical protein
MTINEAYIKGLDDAENAVITKLMNTLNDVNDPFMNPKLEEVRLLIVDKLSSKRDTIDKDRLLKVFNSILKGTPSRLTIQDEDIEELRQRYQTVMMTVYGMTQKRTSFAKQMRKILKQNSSKGLISDEDVLN